MHGCSSTRLGEPFRARCGSLVGRPLRPTTSRLHALGSTRDGVLYSGALRHLVQQKRRVLVAVLRLGFVDIGARLYGQWSTAVLLSAARHTSDCFRLFVVGRLVHSSSAGGAGAWAVGWMPLLGGRGTGRREIGICYSIFGRMIHPSNVMCNDVMRLANELSVRASVHRWGQQWIKVAHRSVKKRNRIPHESRVFATGTIEQDVKRSKRLKRVGLRLRFRGQIVFV